MHARWEAHIQKTPTWVAVGELASPGLPVKVGVLEWLNGRIKTSQDQLCINKIMITLIELRQESFCSICEILASVWAVVLWWGTNAQFTKTNIWGNRNDRLRESVEDPASRVWPPAAINGTSCFLIWNSEALKQSLMYQGSSVSASLSFSYVLLVYRSMCGETWILNRNTRYKNVAA